MRETPYKHKKNGHCRSPIARGKIFEVAFGVEHLSTAIQWALGNRLCRPPPLARRCTEHFQWTQRDPRTVRGSWRGSPALPRWGDGAGAAAMPGDAAGWQQGFPSASPHGVRAAPSRAQPRFSGFGRRHSLSLRQISTALWAIISLHFQLPHHKKP